MNNLVILIGLVTLFLPSTQSTGSIYSIDDERVRLLDLNPVLGRGYSIMTNQFHSTCLVVEETTVPSYNYDCK